MSISDKHIKGDNFNEHNAAENSDVNPIVLNTWDIRNAYSLVENSEVTLAGIIVPVKYSTVASYIIPQKFLSSVVVGSWVEVDFGRKTVKGVVAELSYASIATSEQGQKESSEKSDSGDACHQKNPAIKYKEISQLLPYSPVSRNEIAFWRQLAEYYMCTPGEILKAAYPDSYFRQEGVKAKKTPQKFIEEAGATGELKTCKLSGSQETAYNKIRSEIDSRPVLLNGVTGSGKTEIYINLAIETLKAGKQVLFMVPEISLSRQLQLRLKKVFGSSVVTYHSQQTPANKHFIVKLLQYGYDISGSKAVVGDDRSVCGPADDVNIPIIVLGTRSSIFLPYRNLGLIIVDEEHDASYKQTEPNPRYNGRDAALMLARLHGAKVILGSATPSLESLYNVYTSKYALVELNETYYGATAPEITVIDTLKVRKTNQMVGNFSQQLINLMMREIENGGQIMLFRNRRSYSPQIECFDCGYSPVCPHCNVHLSYHKATNTLVCHHCEYTRVFNHKCDACGGDNFIFMGTGTERIEEELASLFPNVKIARYDADSSKSIKYQQQTLKAFTEGEIRILVGTQMISKGFDFPHLSMVVVMQAETMVGVEDFRADERAMQLLRQIMGRTGRREARGKFIIQTSSANHPVFKTFVKEFGERLDDGIKFKDYMLKLLNERKEFGFAPFVRMVKLIIRHKNPDKLSLICSDLKSLLIENSNNIQYLELTGPFAPIIDKVRGEYIKCFYLKFARNNHLSLGKRILAELVRGRGGSATVVMDVDPL